MFPENRDACDVCQGLADEQVGVVQFAPVSAEQTECAQHGARSAHWDGVHGGETGRDRGGDEPRPPLCCPVNVGDRNRLAGGVAVHAWTVVGL